MECGKALIRAAPSFAQSTLACKIGRKTNICNLISMSAMQWGTEEVADQSLLLGEVSSRRSRPKETGNEEEVVGNHIPMSVADLPK